jgi:hypothetical protein
LTGAGRRITQPANHGQRITQPANDGQRITQPANLRRRGPVIFGRRCLRTVGVVGVVR